MPWTGSKEDLKAYRRSYYERNGEAIRAKNRERNRLLTPETRRRHMLMHRYGITPDEFDAMLEAQQGACAVCGEVPTKGCLGVDHDHATGKVRGLLCRRCNAWLSLFEKPEMYTSAMAYLGENMTDFVEQQPGCGPPAPVPILQHEAEFEVLLELYRRLEPSNVLEIGTYHGGTLYHWLQNTSRPGAKIVTVDSYAVGVDNRHLYDDWNVNDTHLVVIDGDSHSQEVEQQVRAHGPFDFVFIDAGHYYREVKRDWEFYRPMVKPGGMICLHDILTHPAWPSIEVGRLWDEVKGGELSLEIVADRDAEWGGIAVVMVP